MPIFDEIANQGLLFSVVLSLGVAAGWAARQMLLSLGKKPVVSTLYEVRGKFHEDEVEVFSKMRFITGQINQLRAAAEAQQLAASLTEEKMRELYSYVRENFLSDEIPKQLDDVTKSVRTLEASEGIVRRASAG